MTREEKRQASNIEQILLTKKNCHRASKVVSTVNPEQGEYFFYWRGKKLSDNLMHCDYAHTATRISDNEDVVIYDKDMGSWYVGNALMTLFMLRVLVQKNAGHTTYECTRRS